MRSFTTLFVLLLVFFIGAAEAKWWGTQASPTFSQENVADFAGGILQDKHRPRSRVGRVISDIKACTHSVTGTGGGIFTALGEFHEARKEYKNRKMSAGFDAVSAGIHGVLKSLISFSNALEDCGVDDAAVLLQHTVPDFTEGLNVTEKVLSHSIDVTNHIDMAAESIQEADYAGAGAQISELLLMVYTRPGGKANTFLEKLGSTLSAISDSDFDLKQCRGDVSSLYRSMNSFLVIAANTVDSRDISDAENELKDAVSSSFQDSLVTFSDALTECGLDDMAEFVKHALTDEDKPDDGLFSSRIVKRVLGVDDVYIQSANVVHEISDATEAWMNGEYGDAGVVTAELLLKVVKGKRARKVLEAVPGVVEAFSDVDMSACVTDFSEIGIVFWDLEKRITDNGISANLQDELDALSDAAAALADGLDDCGFRGVANIIDKAFGRKKFGASAWVIRHQKLLLKETDITKPLKSFIKNYNEGNYLRAGIAFAKIAVKVGYKGQFASFLKVAVNAIGYFDDFDLDACKSDVEDIVGDLQEEFAMISTKDGDKMKLAFNMFIGTMDTLATALQDCGVENALEYFSTYKNAKVSENAHLFLQGVDVTGEVVDAANAWSDGNSLKSGALIVKPLLRALPSRVGEMLRKFIDGAVSELGTSDFDWEECKSELSVSWADLRVGAAKWKEEEYRDSVAAYGDGLASLSDAFYTCGVRDAAKILANGLSAITGTKVIVKGLKVLVSGLDIFHDLGDMWDAYEQGNYYDFGKAFIKIVKDIVMRRKALMR